MLLEWRGIGTTASSVCGSGPRSRVRKGVACDSGSEQFIKLRREGGEEVRGNLNIIIAFWTSLFLRYRERRQEILAKGSVLSHQS